MMGWASMKHDNAAEIRPCFELSVSTPFPGIKELDWIGQLTIR